MCSRTEENLPNAPQRPTILIVDDDAGVRRTLVSMLSGLNFEVVAAGTLEEASAVLRNRQPDLVLVDVRLGDYNGLQLIATNRRPIRAIVITGFPDAALERDARDLGAGYLTKPVNRKDLIAAVAEQLKTPPVYAQERAWPRKSLKSETPVLANGQPAQLTEVSHGGMRFTVAQSLDDLPAEMVITLPRFAYGVRVSVIWKSRHADHWVVGAALASLDTADAGAWRALVDTLI